MRKILVIADTNPKGKVFTLQASVKDTVANLIIDGGLYDFSKNNADLLRTKIKDLKTKGAVKASVHLSTKGGDVFLSRDIANILEAEFGADNVIIKTGAVVASAGTYLTSKFRTIAKRNTQFMIHKPMVGAGGNEDELESKLKLAKDTTTDYVKVYAKKTAKTEEEVRALLAKGDVWMTADEALKEGFIDEVEDEDYVITSEDVVELVACGAPNIPTVTNTQINTKIMDKDLLIAQLGLPADATDADIKAEIKRLKDAEVKAEADAKATKEAEVKAFLDKAEQDKKFTPELRASYAAMAEANFEHTKKIVDALPTIEAPSASMQTSSKADVEVSAERKDWTLKDYQEKDPEAFAQLSDEKQKELADAYYSEND